MYAKYKMTYSTHKVKTKNGALHYDYLPATMIINNHWRIIIIYRPVSVFTLLAMTYKKSYRPPEQRGEQIQDAKNPATKHAV